jgi:hypothetical protein
MFQAVRAFLFINLTEQFPIRLPALFVFQLILHYPA